MAENTVKEHLETGNISVHTENIFPIIKRSLYSDHEIFLRELVSNAVDACQKIEHLAAIGKYKDEVGDLKVEVKLDKENRTITVSDNGIGMNADEVKKYINQVAFSGAEEFVRKYKDAGEANKIIGHFGLGFYSAFMVSEQVEILTRSYQKNKSGVRWECDGTTAYSLDKIERKERGTDVVLHIDQDSEEFLDEARISFILNKYCRFLPVPVHFNGKVINQSDPLWKKQPADITDEEYQNFFKELYPYAEEPLFWIHLNVDFPFNLTGILYFPKLKNQIDVQKNKIQLYSRQVFITDEVANIVPEYLTLLQGVIDSPDIPLNVSRSSLQTDSNVRKISSYISKKVADKLHEIYKEDEKAFREKWQYIEVFVKYGMLSDEKFAEKAEKFCQFRNTDGEYFTWDEYSGKIKAGQTDKNGQLVVLYTQDARKQDSFIQGMKKKGYDVLEMDSMIDSHFIGYMERKHEKTSWKRVDADSPAKIIEKDVEHVDLLSDDQKKEVVELLNGVKPEESMEVQAEPLGSEEFPVVITRPEFMRRMKDMAATGQMSGFDMPDQVHVIANTSHPKVKSLIEGLTEDTRKQQASQLMDLALLSQDMLTGDKLTKFIERSLELMD